MILLSLAHLDWPLTSNAEGGDSQPSVMQKDGRPEERGWRRMRSCVEIGEMTGRLELPSAGGWKE